MTSDLQYELSEQANMQEEKVDPLVGEDVQEDRWAYQEDHWMCRPEEITIETEMTLKEMMRAIIWPEK